MANLKTLLKIGFLFGSLSVLAETYDINKNRISYPNNEEYGSLYHAMSPITAFLAISAPLVLRRREQHEHENHCCGHYH